MLFNQILSHFPQKGLKFVFAYGSGIFRQHGSKDLSSNMLDFVFVVDDSYGWHQENLIHNSAHYSSLKRLGPKCIVSFQDRLGAGVYYNTLVKCEGRLIKYGVINKNTLINDLLDWESLYISGRLHKPVSVLLPVTDADLNRALETNLTSAIHTALLLLPETFTAETLFLTVAGLSYSGDIRMTVRGEDRNKIRNIVHWNLEHFHKMYDNVLLANAEHLNRNHSFGKIEQCKSTGSLYHHLNLLPKCLMFAIVKQMNSDGRHRDTEEVFRSLAHSEECANIVSNSLTKIVKYSSISQSLKGIVTAGFLKSMQYSFSKLKKGWIQT